VISPLTPKILQMILLHKTYYKKLKLSGA
jgi:hypothetical protein